MKKGFTGTRFHPTLPAGPLPFASLLDYRMDCGERFRVPLYGVHVVLMGPDNRTRPAAQRDVRVVHILDSVLNSDTIADLELRRGDRLSSLLVFSHHLSLREQKAAFLIQIMEERPMPRMGNFSVFGKRFFGLPEN
jgi:hypothetical protein